MRNLATVQLPAGSLIGDNLEGQPYTENTIERETQYVFRAGLPVYELVSQDGQVYVMQSYSKIVDPTLTQDDLPTWATGSISHRVGGTAFASWMRTLPFGRLGDWRTSSRTTSRTPISASTSKGSPQLRPGRTRCSSTRGSSGLEQPGAAKGVRAHGHGQEALRGGLTAQSPVRDRAGR